MRVRPRPPVLLALALLATAGSAHAVEGGEVDRATTHSVAIARGSPSSAAVACSGTLISPTVVLTVRHCLAPLTKTGERPCDGELGDVAPDAATSLWVNGAPWTADAATWKRARDVKTPTPRSICGDDIALLVLETPFQEHEAVPARPVVDEPTFLRVAAEQVIGLAGFGVTAVDADDMGTRRSRFDIAMGCVPGRPAFRCGPELDFIDYDREFTTGRGPCRGDSGGGAIAASDRSLVLGVLSRGGSMSVDPWGEDGDSDAATCALGVFERTDRWAWLIARTVLDAATPQAPAPGWATALFPERARVGELCKDSAACEEGAGCISLDGQRSWRCAKACAPDGSCAAEDVCKDGYCVAAPARAPANEPGCALARGFDGGWMTLVVGGIVVALGRRRRVAT